MDERTGEAYELDEKLTVVGPKLDAGDAAPDFALEYMDPATNGLRTVNLAESNGRVRIVNTVNSLDTPVCHTETRKWESVLMDLPAAVVAYTVSMDLPFALDRYRGAEHVDHPLLSAHKNEQFGRDYGVLIKEWRLLQRAVFVIDRDGKVTYSEYVADQMREPNYGAAMEAVRRASDLGGVEF